MVGRKEEAMTREEYEAKWAVVLDDMKHLRFALNRSLNQLNGLEADMISLRDENDELREEIEAGRITIAMYESERG